MGNRTCPRRLANFSPLIQEIFSVRTAHEDKSSCPNVTYFHLVTWMNEKLDRHAELTLPETTAVFFFAPPQIKLAFFVAIVGVVLTVLGVGTEFWVELAPPKGFYNNQVRQYRSPGPLVTDQYSAALQK